MSAGPGTTSAPERWKTVPLVGDNVVVTKAQSRGRSLNLSTKNGYHVWVTQETGEKSLDLDLLIPSSNPRSCTVSQNSCRNTA